MTWAVSKQWVLYVAVALLVLTAVFRLWNLSGSHIFLSDEGHNAWMTQRILSQHELIIHGSPPYYGPLAHYVTAGLVWLFSPSIFILRLVPALASIGASVIAAWLLFKIAHWRGMVLGLLLMIVSPYLIEYGRLSMEMAMNVLFVMAALACAYQYIQRQRMWWALAVGICVGLAAHGHLYIVLLSVAFGISCVFSSRGWQRKSLSLLFVFIGTAIGIMPVLITALADPRDFFYGYGAQVNPDLVFPPLVKVVGYAATFVNTTGVVTAMAVLLAFLWGIYRAVKYRDKVALLLCLPVVFVFILMPFLVLPLPAGLSGQIPVCTAISSMVGGSQCVLTHTRYFDILFPLPLLLVAWALAHIKKHQAVVFVGALLVLVGPLVAPSLATVKADNKGRIGYVVPLLSALPPKACVIVDSAERDYKRMLAFAGERRVWAAQGNVYPIDPSDCDGIYVVTTLQPLVGPHLTLVDTAGPASTPWWYAYRLTTPSTLHKTTLDREVLDDVLCPAVGQVTSTADRFQVSTDSAWQGMPLHVLTDCAGVHDAAQVSLDGKNWHEACGQAPPDNPPTRWNDSGLSVKASSGQPISVYVWGNTTASVREMRLCPNVPRNIEAQLYADPVLID